MTAKRKMISKLMLTSKTKQKLLPKWRQKKWRRPKELKTIYKMKKTQKRKITPKMKTTPKINNTPRIRTAPKMKTNSNKTMTILKFSSFPNPKKKQKKNNANLVYSLSRLRRQPQIEETLNTCFAVFFPCMLLSPA